MSLPSPVALIFPLFIAPHLIVFLYSSLCCLAIYLVYSLSILPSSRLPLPASPLLPYGYLSHCFGSSLFFPVLLLIVAIVDDFLVSRSFFLLASPATYFCFLSRSFLSRCPTFCCLISPSASCLLLLLFSCCLSLLHCLALAVSYCLLFLSCFVLLLSSLLLLFLTVSYFVLIYRYFSFFLPDFRLCYFPFVHCLVYCTFCFVILVSCPLDLF